MPCADVRGEDQSRDTHRSLPRPEDPRTDPQIAALLALAALPLPRRPAEVFSARQRQRAQAEPWSALSTPAAAEDTMTLPGPQGPITARVFWPSRRRRPTAPAIVYIHGGGYALGSPDSFAHLTRALCRFGQAIVVSPAYRLAPEHPFPAAVEDCLATVRWVHDHAKTLGVDRDAVFVAGDSAGGNAAAAVALMLRDVGDELLAGMALLCPWLDMELCSLAYRRHVLTDPVVDDASVRLLRDLYLQGTSSRHPLVSPVYADLRDLPPAHLVIGETDPLRDDGVTFAERLEAAGGFAELAEFPGMPHQFVCVPFVEPASRALRGAGSFVRRVAAGELERSPSRPRGREQETRP